MKLFSRDTVDRLRDEELLKMCRLITERLFAAIQVLRDRRRRAAYDAIHLDVLPAVAVGIDVVAAEDAYHRGRVALDEGDPKKAFDYFARAVTHDEHTPMYALWLGWARFRMGVADRNREAMVTGHDEIKAALLEDGTSDAGFVMLANCYAQTGNRAGAVRFYRKALGLNRLNSEAKAGLRRVEKMGNAPTRPDSGSFFALVKR